MDKSCAQRIYSIKLLFHLGAAGVTVAPPSSPQAGSKRKKLKAKRDRGSTTPKRSGSPRRPSESDLATSPSFSATSGSSSAG